MTGPLDVELLTIDLTGVELFVGAGGVFTASSTVDTANATGFYVADAELHLAILSVKDPTPLTPPTDTRKWTGIAAQADGLSVVGLPADFTIGVDDLSVQFNKAAGTDGGGTPVAAVPIDWNVVVPDTGNPLNGLGGDTALAVSGSVSLNLGGYVLVAGSFDLAKTSQTVTGLTKRREPGQYRPRGEYDSPILGRHGPRYGLC